MPRNVVCSGADKLRVWRMAAQRIGWAGSAVCLLIWVCRVGGDVPASPKSHEQRDLDVMPLTVTERRCGCVLKTRGPGDQFYLIVGSLRKDASTRVTVRADKGADGPERLSLEGSSPDPVWHARIAAQARWLSRQRRERPGAESFPALPAPARLKTFHIFVGERDLGDAAQYQVVAADLHSVGERVQVYLDHNDREMDGIEATVAAIVRIFDNDVAPWADAHLGRACDVDRDGRFTILVTSKLGALQNGKVGVDGFVRGSDFFRDLPAPFSNRCDMLYLNAALKPGPQLRAVLAHEYTHAVTFCEHGLCPYDGKATNLDEEGWLSEGLAHLVEAQRALGWSNLDYRISAYLAEPEHFPLVVTDYFGAGAWRNPGMRGAAFLFLRSCMRHGDADLPRRLVQSPLRGIVNLETATQKPFAELFRRAAVDLLDRQNYGYLSSDETGAWLCGPRFQELALSGAEAEVSIAPTAAAYFLLHSPATDFARIRVEADGPVQVTLLRMPTESARLGLAWTKETASPCLELTAHGRAVRIRRAGWQGVDRESEAPLAPSVSGALLRPGEVVRSQVAAKAKAGRVFKVWGEDTQGRPVAAWIEAKRE